MCLSGEAVACLLLLSPEQRRDYRALVGALDRRYGRERHPELILPASGRRERLPGKSLRSLANEIESLTRRAYGHMTPAVQNELAHDRFILALAPPELPAQTRFASGSVRNS